VTEPLRVLSLGAEDTAGVGYLLSQAFKRLSDRVLFRSAVKRLNYIQYPRDLPWHLAPSVWHKSPVIHVHNTVALWRAFGGRKPYVLHHHGTHYRENAELLNKRVRDTGGTAVVATLDLLDYGDDLTWVPAAYNLAWLRSFRSTWPPDRPFTVGHAPTNRDLKSTEKLLEACDKLGVRVRLIERKTWHQCLTEKGQVDVLFDQTQLGYGHNAIEAWGMGIPVIAGAPARTLQRMTETFGLLPFLDAHDSVESIARAIEVLMLPEGAAYWGNRGLQHVTHWHDGRESVARLTRIYEGLAER
jgi:hypothetical protein